MRVKATRSDCQIRLRLPTELKKKILYSAKLNGRSANSEILIRLKRSFISDDIKENHKVLEELLKN